MITDITDFEHYAPSTELFKKVGAALANGKLVNKMTTPGVGLSLLLKPHFLMRGSDRTRVFDGTGRAIVVEHEGDTVTGVLVYTLLPGSVAYTIDYLAATPDASENRLRMLLNYPQHASMKGKCDNPVRTAIIYTNTNSIKSDLVRTMELDLWRNLLNAPAIYQNGAVMVMYAKDFTTEIDLTKNIFGM